MRWASPALLKVSYKKHTALLKPWASVPQPAASSDCSADPGRGRLQHGEGGESINGEDHFDVVTEAALVRENKARLECSVDPQRSTRSGS